ncbi:hypothetical protein HYX02_04295 [Candidatus Woesearchaeota archaeon]|nr:hypothetical protein [Candidatus Woesearchaeota archaeon]
MHRKKYLHFIASFLILLVLAIPFYTTSAYAAINKITVKGNDAIEGLARTKDSLTFSVQASISNDTITNEQVVLGSDKQFDNCIPISNGSECTLRFPSNGTEAFEAKSVPFTVALLNEDNTTNDAKSSSITIDTKTPQVMLSSQPRFSSQQNVIVTYDVTDFACDDPSCSNKCVGIKSIEFYTSDGAFKQVIEPRNATECNAKSSISIDSKIFNDGANSVFAKAADRFNQVSPEASVTFNVDASAPSVLANSFTIIRKGVSLSTFSPSKVPVEVIVNISGSDLNLNSVTADLSALNPSQNLKNAKASCTSVEDDTSICKWLMDLNPGSAGSKSIVVNASDTSGNTESITITKQLIVDDKGPVVQSLSTTTALEGKVFGKSSGNTVISVFDEATGVSADDIFLRVDGSKVPATSCTKQASWTCTWENINFGSKAQISIGTDTADVLGNAVSEENNVEVSVDKNAPVLKNLNITSIGSVAQAFSGFAKIGDKIAVEANLTEENDVIAFADFSKFVSDASKIAGSCQRVQADEHACTWLTDSINLQASDEITFNFSDNAGNTLIVTKQFRTFGLENATVPDFWSNTLQCSPKTIDRQLSPLINQRIYCQVALKQKSATKSVSTVFIGDAACTGDSSIVQNTETFNKEAGSVSPVIKITLKKDDFKVNNATISCSLNIFSKVGKTSTVTQNPEIENVKINLQFSNLPLGELSEGIQEKIKAAKDDTKGILNMISSLNKLMHIARKICQLFGIIYNILAVYHTVTVLLAGKTDAVCTNILGIAVCPLVYTAKTKVCWGKENLEEGARKGYSLTGNKFCKFVNCQPDSGIFQQWQKNVAGKINQLPSLGVFPSRDFTKYMNPQTNLITATAFACLPGIIYSLDKYRQIKCLYADCLENAVGKDGLPVTVCEDQKAYATCKYVTGEIFAVVPYTAVLDHFLRLIKNALSNPFGILGVGLSAYCYEACKKAAPGATAVYTTCATARLFSTMGEVLGNVKNIIDEGFTIRQDYCSRLQFDDTKTQAKGNSTTANVQK